jgi:hypothetical protein
MNLVRTDAVLAVDHHPHHREPLIKADWGILEDGSCLERELAVIMVTSALPSVMLRLELDRLAPTARASHAVWPSVGA